MATRKKRNTRKRLQTRARAGIPARSASQWTRLAQRELARIVEAAVAERGLGKFLKGLPQGGWGAEVQLVSGPVMKRLNAQYRRKDYATDVLSFPAPAPLRALGMLGELVVCLPVLKRQAREQGHSPERELRVLLVHGMLHLLGMDHERSDSEARRQRRFEGRLLDRLAGARRAGEASPGLIARADETSS